MLSRNLLRKDIKQNFILVLPIPLNVRISARSSILYWMQWSNRLASQLSSICLYQIFSCGDITLKNKFSHKRFEFIHYSIIFGRQQEIIEYNSEHGFSRRFVPLGKFIIATLTISSGYIRHSFSLAHFSANVRRISTH